MAEKKSKKFMDCCSCSTFEWYSMSNCSCRSPFCRGAGGASGENSVASLQFVFDLCLVLSYLGLFVQYGLQFFANLLCIGHLKKGLLLV